MPGRVVRLKIFKGREDNQWYLMGFPFWYGGWPTLALRFATAEQLLQHVGL